MPSVAQLEQQKADYRELMAQRDMALRLKKNRDFNKLVLEEYMVQETARYVGLSADPNLTPEQRADALSMAQASGHFKRWLNVICQMGDKAEHDMEEIDENIEQARIEEENPIEDDEGDDQ